MKKATLALIIGSTLSSVISFANAATVIDAPNNYDPVFTSGESSLLENTALTVFQHDSAINNLTAQASDQGQQLTAQSLRIDQNNYDINQQHSQLTELNNRAGKTEKDVTLLELQRQGLQAAIIDHGDRMNSLQAQTDAEVSARTTLGNQVDGNKQAIANLGSTTKTALINNAAENEEQNKALNVLNGQIQMTGTQVEGNKQAIANLGSTTKTALINNAAENEEQNKALNVLNGQIQVTGTQVEGNKQAIANLGSTTKNALINNAAENEEQNKALNVLNGQIQVTGTQVEGNKQAIANLGSTTKTALINNAAENEEQNKALNELGGQIQMTGAYAKSRTDAAIANAENNKAALAKTNQAVAAHSAELANHESRIDALEANTGAGNSFARLKNQVDDNRQRASAGIAGVAAMANIPQVTQGATFSVGAGAGTTDGESALAVGFSARATENTVIKASVSNDSQQNFVVGAGAAYQW